MEAIERELQLFTAEEYLTIERDAPFRSEFDNGRIYAMAGASSKHWMIVDNITGFLYVPLRKSSCRAATHDAKVRIGNATAYYYPDVVIICDASSTVFEDGTIENPVTIFEVLSPTTEAFDRVVKYNRHRELESLRDYLLVEQNAVQVTHHYRAEAGGEWITKVYSRLEEQIILRGVPATLTVEDIYDRIEMIPIDDPAMLT